ncbi:hypothetical protein [Herbidospora cretacea]|uniref:hypothetical protein n=1 Tax=Herbidospora cretacea TaxID=28444 RepID=UPI000773A03B|nr:hypothetical protein [Herbidospora cretacea]
MPTLRRLAMLGAAAGTVVLAALATLVLMGALPVVDALLLVLLGGCLAGLGLLVFSVRRLDGKTQRIDTRVKKLETNLARVTTTLGTVSEELAGASRLLAEGAARRDDDLRAVLAALGEDRVNAMFLRNEVEAEIKEIRRITGASPRVRTDVGER